jgi:putative FmdB family regulatory protein
MPIYEYKCMKCGSEFEVFKKMTEPDEKSCKFCKGLVKKLVSLSSFQLQGSGWYATDYAGKKPKAGENKKEADAVSPVESASKKEDSSPATTEKK